MTKSIDALLTEVHAVIAAVSQLTESDGVTNGQHDYVLSVLGEYVAYLEKGLPIRCDFNRIARLVVEYWPLGLVIGERVIAVERQLRSFPRETTGE
jgi:hypothetical protein